MINTSSFDEVVTVINLAFSERNPGKIFGELQTDGLKIIDKIRLELSKIIHPDMVDSGLKIAADDAFKKMQKLYSMAQDMFNSGVYTVDSTQVLVKSKKDEYSFMKRIATGDVCEIWLCRNSSGDFLIAKVALTPADSDLMNSEVVSLTQIHKDVDNNHKSYYPEIVDSFKSDIRGDKKQVRVNVLGMPVDRLGKRMHPNAFYTLASVNAAYPSGINAKDMAWIWRRTLYALDYYHGLGLIHGALTPDHILIEPSEHGVVIIGWTSSVNSGKSLKIVSSAYKQWYPDWALTKDGARKSLDIMLAAKTMVDVTSPLTMPPALKSYFRRMYGGIFTGESALQALSEFDIVIKHEWGDRSFRKFPDLPENK